MVWTFDTVGAEMDSGIFLLHPHRQLTVRIHIAPRQIHLKPMTIPLCTTMYGHYKKGGLALSRETPRFVEKQKLNHRQK